jgi:S1-C subfamily serine protease
MLPSSFWFIDGRVGALRRPDARQRVTGFFITDDGYLVSNYHVVKDATKVRLLTGLRRDEVATATQAGAGLIDAKVVQVDAANDLALVKAVGRFACLPNIE